MSNRRLIVADPGGDTSNSVKISTEQILDNLHSHYLDIISKLTEANASLQAALDNTEVERAELLAFKEAMMDEEEEG